MIDGTIPFPTPVVLGHEGAGVVEEVGDAVTKVKVGDHVVLTTLGNCGQCDACDRGQPTHCRDTFGRLPRPFTVGGEKAFQFANAGVFAEHTVVNETQAVVIDPDVPLEVGLPHRLRASSPASAPCSTGPRCSPGQTVVVIGVGGIGLNVIQAARSPTPADHRRRHQPGEGGGGPPVRRHPLHRRRPGRRHGRRGQGDRLPNGVDHVFECVGHPALIRQSIDLLDWGGNCVLLGVPKLGTEASFVVNDALQRQVDPGLPLRHRPARTTTSRCSSSSTRPAG